MSITHDNATSANGVDVSSLSWSHAIGSGDDRLMTIKGGSKMYGSGTDIDFTSMTYNSQAFTLPTGGTQIVTEGTQSCTAQIRHGLNAILPAAGTYTVEITGNNAVADLYGEAESVTGAVQQAPEANGGQTVTADSDNISSSITTLTDGAWLFDCLVNGSIVTGTAGTDQVERSDQGTGSSSMQTSTKPVATAGATAAAWTLSATVNRKAHVVLAFKAADVLNSQIML